MQSSAEVVHDNASHAREKATTSGSRWWIREPSGDPDAPTAIHDEVFGRALVLKNAWKKMETQDRIHDRIYENRALRPGGAMRAAVDALERAGFRSARLFVTTSIVDTFVSRISKKKSMPMFVVDDAEWSLKRKAQRFRKFLHAKLRDSDFERLCPEIVRDCCVRGTGVAYVDEHDRDVLTERVHRHELLLEPREARMGPKGVRQIHWVRQIAREVLAAKFPEFRDAIASAPASKLAGRDASTGDDWLLSGETAESDDVVDVVFSWHLDSGGDECDGRRAICLEDTTLVYDEWKADRFPFVFLHRYKPMRGFWGRGDVELLADLQARVNAIVRDVQQNLDVHGKIMVAVNEQYDIPVEKLTGRYPYKLLYRGPQPPQWIIPQPVSQGQIQALEILIAKMHDLTGVSMWATSSKNPIGAGASGIALDTFYDIESERHAVFEEDYGHFRLDVARLFLDCGYRVVEREKEHAAREAEERRKARKRGGKVRDAEERMGWADAGGLTLKDWDDLALERKHCKMQLEPVSFIPSTRAGKLAAAKELSTSGIVPGWIVPSLFDEPDLAHANRIALAPFNNLERIMEDLADEDKEVTLPEPEHDLEMAVTLGKAFYNRRQAENAPEMILRRYREFTNRAIALRDKGKTPPAQPTLGGAPPPGDPAMTMGGAPPPGGGMMPPEMMAGGAPPMMAAA